MERQAKKTERGEKTKSLTWRERKKTALGEREKNCTCREKEKNCTCREKKYKYHEDRLENEKTCARCIEDII